MLTLWSAQQSGDAVAVGAGSLDTREELTP
jgi:hypothetical protein